MRSWLIDGLLVGKIHGLLIDGLLVSHEFGIDTVLF